MIHRQPELPLARRIIAAGCAVVWLAGVSACNLDALFCCDSSDSETAARADQEHSPVMNDAGTDTNRARDADAHHSNDTDGPPHSSHKHDSKEGSCCSSLKAVEQTAEPVVFSKPAFQVIPFLCVPRDTLAASLALSKDSLNRPAKSNDRVFTPEVCLGPAFRSHGPPPSSDLIGA